MGDQDPPQSRVRQACDPCRRKKVKCPGEKPSCSFCTRLSQQCSYTRSSDTAGFRVEKSYQNENGHFADGLRVRRLEARVEQIMDSVSHLVGLQNGQSAVRQSSPAGPHVLNPAQVDGSSNASRDRTGELPRDTGPVRPTEPPPQVLQSLVQLYIRQISGQPLSLFDVATLPDRVRRFSQPLLYSFLALTIRYSDNAFFYGTKQRDVDFYGECASKMLIAKAMEPSTDATLLQALCLLSLGDIADGKPRRAWMKVGVAVRTAVSTGVICDTPRSFALHPDISRSCWALFTLDRIHGSSFRVLPSLTSSAPLPEMPLSPMIPETSLLATRSEPGEALIERDAGIASYALRLLSIWGHLMAYLKDIRNGVIEDAWSVGSSYQKIKSDMSRFETSMPEAHRVKYARFHELGNRDLEKDRAYWTTWIFTQALYHTIHCTLNHPFLHIARVPGRKTLRSPSFLQHTTDQAVLHSRWVILIVTLCKEKELRICDPFIGHLAAMIMTALFFLRFSKDESLVDRARTDFQTLRIFVEDMAQSQSHLQHTVSKLSRLAQFAETRTSSAQTPKVETALLWDLLDYAMSTSPYTDSGEASDNVELSVNTQYLLPVDSDAVHTPILPLQTGATQANEFATNVWDDTLFEFDMTDFSDMPKMATLGMSSESWITGHL